MCIWKILPTLQPSVHVEIGILFFKAAGDLNISCQHFSLELDRLPLPFPAPSFVVLQHFTEAESD